MDNSTIGPLHIAPLSKPNRTDHAQTTLRKGDWKTMNSLDRFMEFLVAAVFIFVGLSKILTYRLHMKPSEAGATELVSEFPYWCIALVGLFEMGAAMALVTPFELTLFAAVALALSTMITGLYRVSVNKPTAPTLVLFLLALFVICGRVL